MIEMFKKVFFILIIIVFSSCVSKKDIVYFQFDNEISKEVGSNMYTTVFKPGDMLQIIITAMDPLVVKHFNLTSSGSESGILPYIIDNNGLIEFPVLGKVKLGGLTKEAAVKLFKNKLSESVKNSGVHIKILNFNITILGDVASPGNYIIPNERINIIEAIGLAGDLTFTGKRNNIMVKREEGNSYKYYQLDIRSKKIGQSPAYYLRQNDVIYVEPTGGKIMTSSLQSITPYLSIISLLTTIGILITR